MARLLASALLLVAASAHAQDVPLEYRVKAAYLLNFARFVDWPPSAFREGEPFHICVAGRNPFGSELADTVRNETVAGRTLSIRVIRDDVASCHLLFIPSGVAAAPFLRQVADSPTLTVSESPGFLGQGGHINFVVDQGKVRFEISQAAAMRQRLTISSRLLKLAVQGSGSGAGAD
jgi:hypothetical protein